MEKTGIQEAVDAMGDGGQPKLAALLGVTKQAVQEWVGKGYAPVGRCRQIELVTKVDRRRLCDPAIADLFSE